MAGMFENNLFTLIQKTLDFRTQRQDLLTSNIANKGHSRLQSGGYGL